MRILVLLCAPLAVYAGQSLNLTSTGATFPLPALNGSHIVEMQLHVKSGQPSIAPPVGQNNGQLVRGAIKLYLRPDGRLDAIGEGDSAPDSCYLALTGRTNVLLRLQRNFADSKLYCEIWNVDGTGYASSTATMTTMANVGAGDTTLGGGSETDGAVGFFRAYAGTVPLGSKPPATATAGTYVVHAKLDGDLTDSSGNGYDGTKPGATYVNPTPGLATVVAAVQVQGAPAWMIEAGILGVMKVGIANTLDGSRSYSMADASDTVTYAWTQTAGPTTATWTGETTVGPTVSNLAFGPYTFRLVVTDTATNTDTLDADVGAVDYSADGTVSYPDARLTKILGPMKVLGFANGWEWFDKEHAARSKEIADTYEVNGGTKAFEAFQATINGVAPTGTAYVALNSNKIYGVGTNFCQVLCGAATCAGLENKYVTPLIPHSGGAGAAPKTYARSIATCNSNTEVTMTDGWLWERDAIASPGVPWTAYGFCANCGDWRAGSNIAENDNYYDNALGHYALYYRSGSKKARDAARFIVDNYYRLPTVYSFTSLGPRFMSLGSAMIRATADYDAGMTYPNRWPNYYDYMDYCALVEIKNAPIGDERENAYCLWYTALQAQLDSDETRKTTLKDRLVSAWTWQYSQDQHAEGYWSGHPFEDPDARVFQVANGSTTATRVAGDAVTNTYCGTTFTQTGTISLDANRVLVTGTGTNFVGSAGKMMVLRGTLDGEPWSMLSVIASSPTPTATSLTLTHPWRGDQGSVIAWRIYDGTSLRGHGVNGGAEWYMFFGRSDAAGAVPSGKVVDDDNWYWCTVVDGDTITLDKPYTGDTSTGNVYRRTDVYHPGYGSQPYMDGLMAQALYAAADALATYNPTVAANYKTAADATVNYLWSYARNPDTKGLYYLYGFPHCKNPSIRPMHACQNADNERDYYVETIGAFAQRYIRSRSVQDRTRGDTVYTDLFAKAGYSSLIEGDGTTATLIDGGNFDYHPAKYYGQVFGVGGGSTWPAARLYAEGAATSRSISGRVAVSGRVQ